MSLCAILMLLVLALAIRGSVELEYGKERLIGSVL